MPFRSDRLREARKRLDLNQHDFSNLCGVGEPQISRYENGKADPYADSLELLAIHLQVSTDYLLGMTDEPRGIFRNPQLSEQEHMVIETMRREGKPGLIRLALGWIAELLEK